MFQPNTLKVIDYLPHRPPMVFIDTIYTVEEEYAACGVTVNTTGCLAPFLNEQQCLPIWFGLEIVAQTIALWSGWHSLKKDHYVPPFGLLLSGRNFKAEVAEIPLNTELLVEIFLHMQDEAMGSFKGKLYRWDAQQQSKQDLLFHGQLNALHPNPAIINQLF